jgi:hypothetical protein
MSLPGRMRYPICRRPFAERLETEVTPAPASVLPMFALDLPLPNEEPPPAKPPFAVRVLRWLGAHYLISTSLLFIFWRRS